MLVFLVDAQLGDPDRVPRPLQEYLPQSPEWVDPRNVAEREIPDRH